MDRQLGERKLIDYNCLVYLGVALEEGIVAERGVAAADDAAAAVRMVVEAVDGR